MDRPLKKNRISEGTEKETPSEPKNLPDLLSSTPFEIIAEILFHTSSPKDVLALTRCSKHFFATLAKNKTSQFIWRLSRALCTPRIPDPTPNFSEVYYASYIFDGGECEVCKRFTREMYSSFAIRARLCGSPACSTKFLSLLISPHHITNAVVGDVRKWLITSESFACFRGSSSAQSPYSAGPTYPSSSGWIRRTEWVKVLDDWDEAIKNKMALEKYMKFRRKQSLQLPQVMQLSYLLFVWKNKRKQIFDEIRRKNVSVSKAFAAKEDVNSFYLTSTPSFNHLFLRRKADLEEISATDYEGIRPKVLEDMERLEARRQRRLEAKAYERRRQMIVDFYHRLRFSTPRRALPPISVFRKLPIVDLFQTSNTCEENVDRKKFRMMAELTHDAIEQWLEAVRPKLADKLGYSSWAATNTKAVHPAERLTARYRCIECDKMKDHHRHRSLDFIDVCGHECSTLGKKASKESGWNSDMFKKDVKASVVVSEILAAYDQESESATASSFAGKASTLRIICTSCTSAIIMNFESIFDHAQRHDKMGLNFLGLEVETTLASDLTSGSAQRLIRTDPVAKQMRAHVEYVCRHCVQKKVGFVLPKSSWSLMTFDGIRSHLKAKHGIAVVGDEDFFRANSEVVAHKTKEALTRRMRTEVAKELPAAEEQNSTNTEKANLKAADTGDVQKEEGNLKSSSDTGQMTTVSEMREDVLVHDAGSDDNGSEKDGMNAGSE